MNVPTQFVGRLGLATFIHSGGVNNAASGLTVGDPANGGFGRYEMSGGTLNAGAVTIRGAFDQTGGSVSAANVGGGGSLRVAGGTFLANHVRTSTLAGDGGLLRVRPGGGAAGTSRTSQLTMARFPGGAPLGTIDLSDNDLVVDYTGASPLGDVASAIRSAHNGGAWNGTGVTSSAAAASASSAVKTALAYAEATDLFTTFPATFSGQSVDATSVLVRYTAYGDANLDGTVNLTDFNALAANFGTAGGATWVRGDFDYDGNVNLADFNLLAGNFGQAVAGPTVTPDDWSALAAAVPEPAGFATLFSGFALCARRRQRQR